MTMDKQRYLSQTTGELKKSVKSHVEFLREIV